MNAQRKEEFLEVISRYQGILHKVCLLYFHNEADRKDNFQEILYQLWKAYPYLKNKGSIASWIYRISINTSIARIRKESRFVNYEQMPETIDETDLLENVIKSEQSSRLLKALKRLNDIDKSIMFLYLEGESYEGIADIIGISSSNVGTKINRIKERLKKNLNPVNHGKQQ